MSAPTYVPGSVPSGYAAPLAAVSDTDHGGWILVATAMGIVLMLLCLGIRVYVRTDAGGPWGVDDTVLGLATAAALVQSSLVCLQVHLGWGRVIGDIDPIDLITAEKSAYAADMFYLVTLALSKFSLALFFRRLSTDLNQASIWISSSTAIWVVASIIAISVRCHLRQPWIDVIADQCSTLLVRWQVISAFNIITEVAIFATSIYLVAGRQMPIARKSVVVIAFGLRLPVIAACVVRMDYFFAAFYSSDPTFDGVIFAICTQVELSYSIMGATIPSLKPFLMQLDTAWGGKYKMDTTHVTTAAVYDAGSTGSYIQEMFSKKAWKSGKGGKDETGAWPTANRGSVAGAEGMAGDNGDVSRPVDENLALSYKLRGDSVGHMANVMHGNTPGWDGGSLRSNDSGQGMIRKAVMYSVEHDDRSAEEKSDVDATSENPRIRAL